MSIFPTTIVVGLDGSVASIAAAEAAADLAQRANSRLHLVMVLDEDLAESGAGSVRRRILGDITRRLHQEQHIRISQEVVVGYTPDELAATVDLLGAGLLMLGGKRRSGIARALLGSVAESVVEQVTCPVLIIRDGEAFWPPLHLVVGDDASEESELAGDVAAEIAALYHADAVLLESAPPARDSDGALEAASMRDLEVLFERRLQARATELGGVLGSVPSTHLVTGGAAKSLLAEVGAEAGKRTMIAVGTQCLSGLARMHHPSVSRRVLREAQGPVLIAPIGMDEYLQGRSRGLDSVSR